jgi:hypothetical protein
VSSIYSTLKDLYEHMEYLESLILGKGDSDGPTSSDFQRARGKSTRNSSGFSQFSSVNGIGGGNGDSHTESIVDNIPILYDMGHVVNFIAETLPQLGWSATVQDDIYSPQTRHVVYKISPLPSYDDTVTDNLEYFLVLDVDHTGDAHECKAQIVDVITGDVHGNPWSSVGISHNVEGSFVEWLFSFLNNGFGSELNDYV